MIRCSNTVGPQLLPHCWLTWAPGTVVKMALGTRMNNAEGQATQPWGIPFCNIPNPSPGQQQLCSQWVVPTARVASPSGALGADLAQPGRLMAFPSPGPWISSAVLDELAEEKTSSISHVATEIRLPGFSAPRLFCTLLSGPTLHLGRQEYTRQEAFEFPAPKSNEKTSHILHLHASLCSVYKLIFF